MEFLSSWLQGIMIAVIVSTLIEMILPNSNSKKYIKVVLGIYVVFNIITPVVNQFFHSDFELSSIFNIEEYTKEMETYEVDTKNIDINKTNENSIKQIYLSNLKSDIEAKLKEKGYQVNNIELEIENDETYQIKEISLSLQPKEQKKETRENTIVINEIEKVEIQIGKTKTETNKEESKLSESEQKEIKKYLTSVYEVKENQITIY